MLIFWFVSEVADVFNCLAYLAYSSLYNLEVSERIFAAVNNIPPAHMARASVKDLARQVALAVAAGHPQESALRDSLPTFLEDSKNCATICRIPAFLAMSMKLDDVQLAGQELDLTTAGSVLALFNKKLPMELFAPQMRGQRLDNRSRQLVNCYR